VSRTSVRCSELPFGQYLQYFGKHIGGVIASSMRIQPGTCPVQTVLFVLAIFARCRLYYSCWLSRSCTLKSRREENHRPTAWGRKIQGSRVSEADTCCKLGPLDCGPAHCLTRRCMCCRMGCSSAEVFWQPCSTQKCRAVGQCLRWRLGQARTTSRIMFRSNPMTERSIRMGLRWMVASTRRVKLVHLDEKK
jgi:hypothetical protein